MVNFTRNQHWYWMRIAFGLNLEALRLANSQSTNKNGKLHKTLIKVVFQLISWISMSLSRKDTFCSAAKQRITSERSAVGKWLLLKILCLLRKTSLLQCISVIKYSFLVDMSRKWRHNWIPVNAMIFKRKNGVKFVIWLRLEVKLQLAELMTMKYLSVEATIKKRVHLRQSRGILFRRTK